MHFTSLIIPVVGSRICSVTGERYGAVVATEKPYTTMDQLLYTIRWDDGEVIKLYESAFMSLGPFQTVSEYQAAIRGSAAQPKLTLGPQGGFRGFEMTVQWEGATLRAFYGQREVAIYRQFIEPCLRQAGIKPEVIQLEGKRRVARPRQG